MAAYSVPIYPDTFTIGTSDNSFINSLRDDTALTTPATPATPATLPTLKPAIDSAEYSKWVMDTLMNTVAATMYCVKCRTKRYDPNAQRMNMRNGKPAIKGRCPICSTGMFKINNI